RPHTSRVHPYTTLFRSPSEEARQAEAAEVRAAEHQPQVQHASAAEGAQQGDPEAQGEHQGAPVEGTPPEGAAGAARVQPGEHPRSEEHTSELQSRENLV